MRKLLALSLTLLFGVLAQAQIKNPVSWSTKAVFLENGEVELQYIATIQDTYHLYALDLEQGGPLPTVFTFEPSKDYILVGKMTQEKPEEVFDKNFNMKVRYFGHKTIFRQKVKLNKPSVKITVEVSYMACNDQECTPPLYKDLVIEAQSKSGSKDATSDENTSEGEKESGGSLWLLFVGSFAGGLLALFTPCVFPMIPLTVSFFLKGQKKRSAEGVKKSVLYGLCIIFIYVGLGLLITAIFGAAALNQISTDPWFNLAFFILLIVFAVSFLGAFEIVLPSSWATAMDQKSNNSKGFLGIFFMAATLAVVSFSCTSPVVGTVLVQSTQGDILGPIVGMFGFSLALAIPFTLFAMFPSVMNSLPKSGGWLNTVKVVLGFLELALALKFLSNADLVLQLHLLERELFIAIWIGIFLALAMYLFGAFRLPHDSPSDGKLSVGRMLLGLTSLIFTFYLLPGLWGAPLKLLSGFPPPTTYQEWDQTNYQKAVNSSSGDHSKYASLKKGPLGLEVYTDYQEGISYAKSVNKPILLDFTGHACVNCRKMEGNVWTDPKIKSILENEVVIVSLYVDDRKSLPKQEQYISKHTNSKIKTIGGKWSEFQIERYGVNAQPYYVIVDSETEKDLTKPVGYTPNIQDYYNWLKSY